MKKLQWVNVPPDNDVRNYKNNVVIQFTRGVNYYSIYYVDDTHKVFNIGSFLLEKMAIDYAIYLTEYPHHIYDYIK